MYSTEDLVTAGPHGTIRVSVAYSGGYEDRDRMSQLYVGNLSSEADEKVVRAVFGKYGAVREAIMKNGYAFVEFESPKSADAAMTDLHGKDLL